MTRSTDAANVALSRDKLGLDCRPVGVGLGHHDRGMRIPVLLQPALPKNR
jgi:hypothetical protein